MDFDKAYEKHELPEFEIPKSVYKSVLGTLHDYAGGKEIAKAFYLPSKYMMLKLMRSCIDVPDVHNHEKISELWFNRNEWN